MTAAIEEQDIWSEHEALEPQVAAPPIEESRVGRVFERLLAGVAAAAMLAPAAIYNIAPNWRTAFDGGDAAAPAAALMSIQIAAVILLAGLPKGRRLWLIVVLMLFNGWAAYITGQQGHTTKIGGNQEKIASRTALKEDLEKLKQRLAWYPPTFTKVGQDEVDVAVRAQTAADKAAATCWKTCAEDRATARRATERAERLTAQRKQTIDFEKITDAIDADEKALRDLGYVPQHADVADGQVASFVGISEQTAASIQIAFVALIVELINRFGPMTAYEKILRLFGQKTHEEEGEEERLAGLEREARRRIREHELVLAEAKVRTDTERAVKEARAALEREEADRKAQAALEEKRRQAALLATPATTHKEAKERAKLEEANGKIKAQREKQARKARELQGKEAAKRSDAAMWVERFIAEKTAPLPPGVDPLSAKIKMSAFRSQCNQWIKRQGGVCEEDPSRFGKILSSLGDYNHGTKRVFFVGRELTFGAPGGCLRTTSSRNTLNTLLAL